MKTVTVKRSRGWRRRAKDHCVANGKTITDVKSEALAYREADFDILEWRVDHFANVTTAESVLEAAGAIREIITDKPLLLPSAARRRRTGANHRTVYRSESCSG